MPIPEPATLTSTALAALGKSLAQGVLKRARRELAESLKTPEAKKALERCGQAAVAALVEKGFPGGVPEDLKDHLEGVLGEFATDGDAHDILAGALRKGKLPKDEVEELESLFREVHAPEETLSGFDVEQGVAAFVVAFVDQADEETVFQGVIQTKALRESVKLQRRLLEEAEAQTELFEEQVAEARRQTEVQREIRDRLPDPGKEAAKARRCYLERLRRECLRLPVGRLLIEQELDEPLTLERVYVALNTKTPREVPKEGEEVPRPFRREPEPLAALEVVAEQRRTVILGDPGSGKSTFARFLLAQLAASILDERAEPPAGLSRNLTPVFVTLRELSGRVGGLDLADLGGGERARVLADAVRDLVLSGLDEEAGEAPFGKELAAGLAEGRCVLVLDGLDEVPEDRRELVREAVLASWEAFKPERLLVTCRVRSYTEPFTLPGFKAHELAPFTRGQIKMFCTVWYKALGTLGGVATDRVEEEGEDFAQAALEPSLLQIVQNPLLLTTMAVLHTRKAELPRERVRVYEESIELLVRDWQRERIGKRLVESEELREFLLDDSRLWPLLQRLAYEAHRVGGTGREVAAGLSEGDLLVLLKQPEHLGSAALAEEFLAYADQRAGLLVGHGGTPGEPAAFGFVHRTFQEYLAGRYLTAELNPVVTLYDRAGEGDLWNVAVELGAEAILHVDRRPKALLGMAVGLGQGDPSASEQCCRAVLWAGKMAALVGREVVEPESHGPVQGSTFLEELRPKLVSLLGSSLPAVERAEAGRALARLGDPREEVLTVDAMELCRVPAGEFLMGSLEDDQQADENEKPQRKVDIPYDYWIGRYPVTQAQFREFVEDGGYGERRFWTEAVELGFWEAGGYRESAVSEPRAEPPRVADPFALPNHPVVGVSWYEALAFCRWLTERWRSGGWVPQDRAVRLPGDAEWEKAARGGLQIPAAPEWSRVDGGEIGRPNGSGEQGAAAVENPEPGRLYPWEGAFLDDNANGFYPGIGSTSAVGCFPGGVSPYGCQELAGNVFEWSADQWKVSLAEGAEDAAAAESAASWVLRGGSFVGNPRYLRAAYRDDLRPEYRFGDVGFRVLVSSGGL